MIWSRITHFFWITYCHQAHPISTVRHSWTSFLISCVQIIDFWCCLVACFRFIKDLNHVSFDLLMCLDWNTNLYIVWKSDLKCAFCFAICQLSHSWYNMTNALHTYYYFMANAIWLVYLYRIIGSTFNIPHFAFFFLPFFCCFFLPFISSITLAVSD